ncbi:hypothetical protein [Nitrospira sp. Nam74]
MVSDTAHTKSNPRREECGIFSYGHKAKSKHFMVRLKHRGRLYRKYGFATITDARRGGIVAEAGLRNVGCFPNKNG